MTAAEVVAVGQFRRNPMTVGDDFRRAARSADRLSAGPLNRRTGEPVAGGGCSDDEDGVTFEPR